MRTILPAILFLVLAACSDSNDIHAVDVTKLPPLSGREQALLSTAQAAEQQGSPAQAERAYMDAVAASKGHVEAHLGLAEFYLKANRADDARAILERAAKYQPGHVAVNYLLGKIALQQNRGSDALAAFQRGLDTQPQSLDLLSGKGIAHDMLRQHAAAQTLYLRALGLNPSADLSLVRTNLGMSYLLDNKPDKAAELLKMEANKPEASPVTRHNLALAYGMLGRNKEARELVKDELSEAEFQANLKKLAQYISGRDMSGKVLSHPALPAPVREVK